MNKTRPTTDTGISLGEMQAFSLLAFGHTDGINYDFHKMLRHVTILRNAVKAECPDYENIADFKF